ncbi:SIMPL domain-containing protein [Pontibacter arcticus]|uniref:SIMPL domain-containing protein n=1 Tax=Pontibacter arcticus TaxID=2080288 RepID=A0A364RDW2_9BACT|nr:SIMPL domain-containing protein [Pontibacter arcticus]RAU82464.1 SIMPL domain-containing protein [Pontibacter arcticus]
MNKLTLTAFLLLATLAASAQSKNFLDQPYLEVTGSADTLVTPNEIYIKILLSEKDTKDKTSVEAQEIKMAKALKDLGINIEKNLTTSDMASNFKTYFLKGKEVLKSKQYILKVSDAVTAGKVFGQLESLDISNTSIDRVDHSDVEGIKNILRSKAAENARTKALALTKPLKQTVGPAIHITDTEFRQRSYQSQGMLNEVVVTAYGVSGAAMKKDETPNIDFHKIELAANINVKFILK